MRRTGSAGWCTAVLCLTVLAVAAVAACSLVAAAPVGDVIWIPLPESDVDVCGGSDGTATFTGTNLHRIGRTGEPSLPSQSVRVLLPPDADLTTVEARIAGWKWTAIEGEWDIGPVGRLMTGDVGDASAARLSREGVGDGRDIAIYGRDALFPSEPVLRLDTQIWRGWKMVQVLYSPYAYNPVEKKLYRLSGNSIEVTFQRSVSEEDSGVDLTAASEAKEMTVNFAQMSGAYGGLAASADTGRYVIITTSAIQAASGNLDDFVASKEARGFTVQVVTEGTWGGGTGDAAAENIRSWLRANYIGLNIKYVLLIGNPNPSTGDVPMKMCYPQALYSEYPDCPTDFYYAELTSSDWDKDGDGKYGEYLDDFGDGWLTGNPPRVAEVAVGRIPYYGNAADLDQILAKIVAYETEPEADISWHRNVLLPMKPSDEETPGYQLGEEIKDDVLVPNGWSYHRVYDEDYGLDPEPETMPCTVTNVTNTWNGSDFGAVFWWTHGSETSATGVMNVTNAATLDNAHPGFTFQASCLNGKPEITNNLGYSLLKNGCIATVSASRVSWYQEGQTSFAGTPTNSGMAFEYANRLIAREMYAGDALNGLRGDIWPYDQVLWMNYLDFNLYGCPAVGLYTPPLVETEEATDVTTDSARLNAELKSFGTGTSATVSFEWGTTPGGPYPNQTAGQDMASPGAFSAVVGGLEPGVTYYFRAKGEGWGVGYGVENSFITLTEPPSVSTKLVGADEKGSLWAVLTGDLEDLGTADNVSVSFEWGLTTAYDHETTPVLMWATGTFSENVTDLAPKTTYHFRAKAVGHDTAFGDDIAFTTLGIPPAVSTENATNLATTSARLNGALSSLGTATTVTVSFEYGTVPGGPYSKSTANQARTLNGPFYADVVGLAPGTTYYYRAKAVGDGTVYGDEGSFTTLTAPPYVTTENASDIRVSGARLNGNLTSLGTAATVSVSFVWGTGSDDYDHETTPEVIGAPAEFHFDLSGLAPNTTYYYRAKAVGHETVLGAEKSFKTGIPPEVSTLDAGDVTVTSATLRGDLFSLGEADNVTVSFVWGNSADCANETSGEVKSGPAEFYYVLDSLSPGTTYYFRAKANGVVGPVFGELKSFTTLSNPPAVATGEASGRTSVAARLNGNLVDLGTATSVSLSFVWGTKPGDYPYETMPEIKGAPGEFHFDLSGLAPGTTYYYRAKAAGHGIALGDEVPFTTLTTPPSVTTGVAANLAATSATLNGYLEALGTAGTVSVSFEWGAGTSYGSETAAQPLTTAGAFTANLTGLTANTTYHFRAKAVGHGDAVYGQDVTFTTAALPDTAAPLIAEVSASDVTKSGATITWTTNEPATSWVEYGLTEGYGLSTGADTSFVESHTVRLKGLKPGEVYHYRVISEDVAGNRTVSDDATFTTDLHSGRTPIWLWALIGIAVVAGLGALLLVFRGRRASQTG
ncbi:MAG: fibronectin type III domain-containing protein [Dehalococcoidia bacterium]|nr:fibronectin type III domain-containing protein [Dehalococcoidia bacterium]